MENENRGLPTRLVLWPGAKIIILSNICVRSGIVNGTVGCVVETIPERVKINVSGQGLLIERETRELKRGGISRSQFPLQLSYSMTIHHAQGLTLPKVLVDLSGLFCNGQDYVAFSRVRSLYDLFVVGKPKDISRIFPHPMLACTIDTFC